MRKTLAITQRELLSFFVSPVAYTVTAGFLILAAYFLFNNLSAYQVYIAQYKMYAGMMGDETNLPNLNTFVIESFFQVMVIILVFTTPLLTMRVIAEERRRGTFELLATSPLSVAEIVVGKFLGLAILLTIIILSIFVFPSMLVLFGDPAPEIGPMISGLLGVLLLSWSFAAVGMAASSFTDNQVIAGVSSVVVLLLLYVIQAPADAVGGNIGEVLSYLSPPAQLQGLLKGVITVKSIVYFLSWIFVGLFISNRALEAFRWR
jgi:ABC-2 type transport system permease protein